MSFKDKVMSMFASMKLRMEALVARMESLQELTIYKVVVST